jgi:hypothetical protein
MRGRLGFIVGRVIVALLISEPAMADATDPAAARELFDEARSLMAKGDFTTAEQRLTAALAYSNGRGIRYQLAVCHEKLGHVARAWKLYAEVAESARTAGEADRERVARVHAADLSSRVPHVRVIASGSTVTIDGERVTTDAPLPIDPGHHAVHAEGAGRSPWDSSIDVHEGETVDVRVPSPEPIATEPASVPSPIAITIPPPPPPRVVEIPPRPSPVRTAGIVVSAAGLATLVAGAGFVIASATTYASSSGSGLCDASDHCSPQGATIRSNALTYGDVATTLVIGGAVALAAGIVMWIAAPKRVSHALALSPVIRF